MKREIDKLYGNYSPATSTDKDKKEQNDAQIDIVSTDDQMDVAKDSDAQMYFRKIFNHMKKR